MCTDAELQFPDVHSDATTSSTDTTSDTAADPANRGIYDPETSRQCVEGLPRYER
jgi:hypothetical protein